MLNRRKSPASIAIKLEGTTSNRDGIPCIWLKQLASGSEVPITEGVGRSGALFPGRLANPICP